MEDMDKINKNKFELRKEKVCENNYQLQCIVAHAIKSEAEKWIVY